MRFDAPRIFDERLGESARLIQRSLEAIVK